MYSLLAAAWEVLSVLWWRLQEACACELSSENFPYSRKPLVFNRCYSVHFVLWNGVCTGTVLFPGMRRNNFLPGASMNFWSPWTYFILFIIFFFFLSTTAPIEECRWDQSFFVYACMGFDLCMPTRTCPFTQRLFLSLGHFWWTNTGAGGYF